MRQILSATALVLSVHVRHRGGMRQLWCLRYPFSILRGMVQRAHVRPQVVRWLRRRQGLHGLSALEAWVGHRIMIQDS